MSTVLSHEEKTENLFILERYAEQDKSVTMLEVEAALVALLPELDDESVRNPIEELFTLERAGEMSAETLYKVVLAFAPRGIDYQFDVINSIIYDGGITKIHDAGLLRDMFLELQKQGTPQAGLVIAQLFNDWRVVAQVGYVSNFGDVEEGKESPKALQAFFLYPAVEGENPHLLAVALAYDPRNDSMTDDLFGGIVFTGDNPLAALEEYAILESHKPRTSSGPRDPNGQVVLDQRSIRAIRTIAQLPFE